MPARPAAPGADTTTPARPRAWLSGGRAPLLTRRAGTRGYPPPTTPQAPRQTPGAQPDACGAFHMRPRRPGPQRGPGVTCILRHWGPTEASCRSHWTHRLNLATGGTLRACWLDAGSVRSSAGADLVPLHRGPVEPDRLWCQGRSRARYRTGALGTLADGGRRSEAGGGRRVGRPRVWPRRPVSRQRPTATAETSTSSILRLCKRPWIAAGAPSPHASTGLQSRAQPRRAALETARPLQGLSERLHANNGPESAAQPPEPARSGLRAGNARSDARRSQTSERL